MKLSELSLADLWALYRYLHKQNRTTVEEMDAVENEWQKRKREIDFEIPLDDL
jgi:uncharacterized protein YfkK (UPF0435 family)